MMHHTTMPTVSYDNLKDRLLRLLKVKTSHSNSKLQLQLGLPEFTVRNSFLSAPKRSVVDFLDFISDSLPFGDVYLFGGVLRDLALFGKKGFNSDIDLVVEGDWENCIPFLVQLGARKNRFGGYRLQVGGWLIDIWNARETWAIKQEKVSYAGICSLIETTVLNWDAILMNWRTQKFICKESYLCDLNERLLDVVLEDNPNPLGMAVRVFRHLCSKDARKITIKAAEYLGNCTEIYSYDDLIISEMKSYRNSVIEFAVYQFFRQFHCNNNNDISLRYSAASEDLLKSGISLSSRQYNFGI